MFVVNPWITVESWPGLICQLIAPALLFSRTIGFEVPAADATVVDSAVAGDVVEVEAPDVEAVVDSAAVDDVVRVKRVVVEAAAISFVTGITPPVSVTVSVFVVELYKKLTVESMLEPLGAIWEIVS